MKSGNQQGWVFDRRVTVSMVVQVVMLGSLILGSWMNLQRQLDLMQKDVSRLLAVQGKYCEKLDVMQERAVAQEYRLRSLEERR